MDRQTVSSETHRMRLWQIQTTLYLVAVLFLVTELLLASQETLRVARQVRNVLYHTRPEPFPAPAASSSPSSSPQ